jgi:hypothetical protein
MSTYANRIIARSARSLFVRLLHTLVIFSLGLTNLAAAGSVGAASNSRPAAVSHQASRASSGARAQQSPALNSGATAAAAHSPRQTLLPLVSGSQSRPSLPVADVNQRHATAPLLVGTALYLSGQLPDLTINHTDGVTWGVDGLFVGYAENTIAGIVWHHSRDNVNITGISPCRVTPQTRHGEIPVTS